MGVKTTAINGELMQKHGKQGKQKKLFGIEA